MPRTTHRHISQPGQPTNSEKLRYALGDREWHTTRELVRRVGHTFGRAKFSLVARGYQIERRRHSTKQYQHEYRLVDEP